MKKLIIYSLIITLLIAVPYFLVSYIVQTVVRIIYFASFTALLFIIGYIFKNNKISKAISYMLTVTMVLSLALAVLELGYFYITGSSFNSDLLLFDKISVSFIRDAITSNIPLSITALIYTSFITVLFYKLSRSFNKQECIFFDKVIKTEKALILISTQFKTI